jgi:hypothetical protein
VVGASVGHIVGVASNQSSTWRLQEPEHSLCSRTGISTATLRPCAIELVSPALFLLAGRTTSGLRVTSVTFGGAASVQR